MDIHFYQTRWGDNRPWAASAIQARADGYDGLEGPVPRAAAARQALRDALAGEGLELVVEICTAGSYVPDRQASVSDHLEDFARQLDAALPLAPRHISCLAGCDAWPLAQSVECFGRLLELATAAGASVSFETHRGRSLFNPWVTRDLALALPALTFTADFSHWCVVCERLIDTETAVLELVCPRVRHVHARVGYEQGPQVPHPAAPEYAGALAAHQRWWERCWAGMRAAGLAVATMTPEAGPDGYLHHLPFSEQPVADLRDINGWMLASERAHFQHWQAAAAG